MSIPHPGQPLSPYVNPFARSGAVTGSRIDQGVDYTGKPGASIGALGPGTIVKASTTSGWPGGGFIGEQLSSGPARGQVAYFAEDVAPTVKVGQKVKAGQQIGSFNQGGWIEAGWGTLPPNVGQALAYGKQSAPGSDPGAYSTGFGIAFNKLLTRLGAPSGKLQSVISGSAPASFSSPGGRTPGPGRVSLPPALPPIVIPSGVNPPATGGVPMPAVALAAATTPVKRTSGRRKPTGPPVTAPPASTPAPVPIDPFNTTPPVTTTAPPTFINSSTGTGGITSTAAPSSGSGGTSTLLLVAGAGVVLVLILMRKKGKR